MQLNIYVGMNCSWNTGDQYDVGILPKWREKSAAASKAAFLNI